MAEAFDAALRAWAHAWAAGVRAQADGFAAMGEDSAEADALWRIAEAASDAARAAALAGAGGAASAPGGATLARFLDPGQWLFGGVGAPDPALRRLIETPCETSMGRAGLAVGPEARALRRALNRHRALVADAFARTADRFARGLADAGPVTLDSAQEVWVEAAAELDALHASDGFLASQAQVLAAGLAMRAAEAAAVETWCAERGLPTRGEIDALQRTVADLRRELRALKRALGQP